jgi:hypothetical protein
MIHAITSAMPADSTIASATPTPTRPVAKPAVSQPQFTSRATSDTVQISSAAQSMLKEATETPAQTAQEARNGDSQAQRLFARETAAEKVPGSKP